MASGWIVLRSGYVAYVASPSAGVLVLLGAQPQAVPASAAGPSFSAVSVPASVAQYAKHESSFSLATVASNVFYPYDAAPPTGVTAQQGVTVYATYTVGASTWQVPAFWARDYSVATKDGRRWQLPLATGKWYVRFTPVVAGSYTVRLTAQDAGGTTLSSTYNLTVTSATALGFIRVASDTRYFERTTGELFFPLGVTGATPVLSESTAIATQWNNFGSYGVSLVRLWCGGVFGAAWKPWDDLRYPTHAGSDPPRSGIVPFDNGGGDIRLTLRLDYDTNYANAALQWFAPCYGQANNQPEAVLPSTTYRVQATYRGVNIASARNGSYDYGLVIKVHTSPVTNAYDPLETNGTVVTTYGKTTATWGTITGTWTSGASTNFLPPLTIALRNTNLGAIAYVTGISVQQDLGGGTYGPNILDAPSFAYHTYLGERTALDMDTMVAAAQTNNVAIKMTLHEKNDHLYKKMDSDGTWVIGAESDNADGLFDAARTLNWTRWHQRAWWRYAQARWGYSPAIHSWETCNEGEVSTNHYALTDELARYMKYTVFGLAVGGAVHPNRHMATASFPYSYPGTEFWKNASYPYVDYADLHAYISTSMASLAEKNQMERDAAYMHLWHSDYVKGWTIGKPTIRGELGMDTDSSRDPNPNVLGISDDTSNWWLHNLLWSCLDSGALGELYWWQQHITSTGWPKFGLVKSFLSNLQLPTGSYVDAAATTTAPGLRVVGQKSTSLRRAHLWVQHKDHIWRNVVDASGGTQGSVNVGEGFVDGTMQQLVRTTAGYVYVVAPWMNAYEQDPALGNTLRVYKSGNTETYATLWAEQDSGNRPTGVSTCAVGIDGADVIHVAYAVHSSTTLTRYLRYRTFSTITNTWGTSTDILSNLDYNDFGQGDEGQAVAIDAAGKVHIVFLTTVGNGTFANRRVYYTNNVSGSWAAAVQVDSGVTYTGSQAAWHPGICFDGTGRLVVSWLRGTITDTGIVSGSDGTVYVRTRETSGTWNTAVSVVSSVEVGIDQSVRVIVTPDNRYHLGCSGAKSGGWQAVYYFYSDTAGTTWTANHPASSTTHNVTVGPGANGAIRLWFHTNAFAPSDINILYREGAGGSGAWGAAQTFATGADPTLFDCSINARWSQYHHAWPTRLDVAYWAAAYPNALYVGSAAKTSPIAALSGTVGLTGFTANASYTLTTINTLTGATASTASVTANSSGVLSLPVTSLTTDVAYTIDGEVAPGYPAIPSDARWVAASGGTNGAYPTYGTQANPWATLSYAVANVPRGGTLVLKNGTYTSTLNLDNLPSGTTNITIMAQTEDGAIIDGQGTTNPVSAATDYAGPLYVTVVGIKAINGSDACFYLRRREITLRRCTGVNAHIQGNSAIYMVFAGTTTTNNILLEECLALGTGRKGFLIFTSTGVTVRRCVAMPTEWDGQGWCAVDWPYTSGFEFYATNYSVMENNISFARAQAYHFFTKGDSGTDDHNSWFGNMAVLGGRFADGTFYTHPIPNSGSDPAGVRPRPTPCAGGNTSNWSAAKDLRAGFSIYPGTGITFQNLVFTDNLVYGNAVCGFTWPGCCQTPPVANSTLSYLSAWGNGLDNPSIAGGASNHYDVQATEIGWFTTAGNKIERVGGGSQQTGTGARLKYRYENGVKGTTPLWPFPINDKIKTQTALHYGSQVDIDAYMTTLNASGFGAGFKDI